MQTALKDVAVKSVGFLEPATQSGLVSWLEVDLGHSAHSWGVLSPSMLPFPLPSLMSWVRGRGLQPPLLGPWRLGSPRDKARLDKKPTRLLAAEKRPHYYHRLEVEFLREHTHGRTIYSRSFTPALKPRYWLVVTTN